MLHFGRVVAVWFVVGGASTCFAQDNTTSITSSNNTSACPDPLAAIRATLDCVEREDPVCASQGYNAALFRKLHNGVDTNTTIDEGGEFWSGSFLLTDLTLDYNHQVNLGPNQASLRYVEGVNVTTGAEMGFEQPCNEYPWGVSLIQHEHAIVTVDDSCKMILWDQYGDNQEQTAVDDAVALILADPAVQCLFGMLPPEMCANVTGPDCRPMMPPEAPSSPSSGAAPNNNNDTLFPSPEHDHDEDNVRCVPTSYALPNNQWRIQSLLLAIAGGLLLSLW